MAEQPDEPIRLTEAELNELARRVVLREVYLANDPQAVQWSFGVVIGMAGWSSEFAMKVGALYEDYSKALSRSINGYPMFLSCRALHQDDLQPIVELIEQKQAAIA